MYYYSTVDNIVMTHSGIIEEDGFDFVNIHFERPNESSFDFLDLKIPGGTVNRCFGFSEDEIIKLKGYAKNNSALIWEFAQKVVALMPKALRAFKRIYECVLCLLGLRLGEIFCRGVHLLAIIERFGNIL